LIIAIGLILATGIAFAIGIVSQLADTQDSYIEVQEVSLPSEEIPQPTRAERIMRAVAEAYPRYISNVEFRNGDWAVLLRDTWLYYAEGRLLPEDLRDRVSEYRPHFFYENYPRELPPWTEPTTEQIGFYTEWSQVRGVQVPRSTYFLDTLYNVRNREESSRQVSSIRFLGKQITVHNAIHEILALVEERILEASRTDSSVSAYVNDIDRMYGWTWRDIAGTQNRSYHAYGVALDIMPRTLGGREVFWSWAGPNWWSIPYERRHHPPDAVIEIFERHGFLWGGKWPTFDTIHFEFRPEVFTLSGIEIVILR